MLPQLRLTIVPVRPEARPETRNAAVSATSVSVGWRPSEVLASTKALMASGVVSRAAACSP